MTLFLKGNAVYYKMKVLQTRFKDEQQESIFKNIQTTDFTENFIYYNKGIPC